MNARVNIIVPEVLLRKSQELVKSGYYSNLSELMRDGLRKQIKEYESAFNIEEDEKKLLMLLKKADSEGLLIDEDEMKKYGLSV